MQHLVLLSVIVLHTTLIAAQCPCTRRSLPETYADATSVVRARVISVTISPTPTPLPCLSSFPPCLPPIILPQSVKYRFRLLAVFKGCSPGRSFRARSFETRDLCGVRLRRGGVFLLNLPPITPDIAMQPDSFSLQLCQRHRLFSRLSRAQRRFLRVSSRLPENQCMGARAM